MIFGGVAAALIANINSFLFPGLNKNPNLELHQALHHDLKKLSRLSVIFHKKLNEQTLHRLRIFCKTD